MRSFATAKFPLFQISSKNRRSVVLFLVSSSDMGVPPRATISSLQSVKLHEYQAKQVLQRAGIPIPDGRLATTPDEAESAAKAIGAPVAVKAQVHAGGRGKAGGIKVAKSPSDAKVDIDDNALFRQGELAKLKEISKDEESEERARALGFSFVQLDGDVGIIGNGAGLVMATLDAVRNAGGRAANFLDVGGGAKEAVVKAALEIVLSNPRVRSVMINIFGGITRGDEVAKGILDVIEKHPPRVPLVVRLSGTEAEAGRKLLEKAPLESRATMDEAAAEAVRLAKEPART